MSIKPHTWVAAGAILSTSAPAFAQTPPYFEPLTESAPVTAPNSTEERNAPWVVPAGIDQENLTSMQEIEGDPMQSILRAPDVIDPTTGEPMSAGTSQSMWDMAAYDATGRFVFIPHESPWGAGLSRYDRYTDEAELLWAGDGQGALENWGNDFGAFDPATFTTNCTVFVAEEWAGTGRLVETLNPFAPVDKIKVRILESIPNVSHEGLRFSRDEKTLYFVDEWNSGAIYKFVMKNKRDYTEGQVFVLSVDDFAGNAADNYNEPSNIDQPRTGLATWVPMTDERGNPLTTVDPFRDGPTNDPRTASDTRGGRPAADELNATPYGRPEDMEVGQLANGNEVVYFAATSEQAIYSIEMLEDGKAKVRMLASEATTPKNVGFASTTGVLNSPDNLAQDALGNIYVVEDAPNGSATGGDIWFVRDVDADGEAESLDHFLSVRASGSEATGMIFNPLNPTQFIVVVMHPESTDLELHPDGFGDAMWQFDVSGVSDRRFVHQLRRAGFFGALKNWKSTKRCAAAMKRQMRRRHAHR